MVLDLSSGEIVAFAEIAFDAFVFRNNVNVVLNRCSKVEIVALNKRKWIPSKTYSRSNLMVELTAMGMSWGMGADRQ